MQKIREEKETAGSGWKQASLPENFYVWVLDAGDRFKNLDRIEKYS